MTILPPAVNWQTSVGGMRSERRCRSRSPTAVARRFFVRGVWRDYARQSGAIVIERAEWLRLSGDPRINQFAAF